MTTLQIIYDHLAGDFIAGDCFILLSQAVTIRDPEKARLLVMRAQDLVRRLEKAGTSAQPPTEHHPDYRAAVAEIRSGVPNSVTSPAVIITAGQIRTNGVTFCRWTGNRWETWTEHSGQWRVASDWETNCAKEWPVATEEQLKGRTIV